MVSTTEFRPALVLTAAGSAWHHWAPDPFGLALDRLGMAVTFAGAIALAVAERVGPRPAVTTLGLVLVMASISAWLPLAHGNVLPWVVVQFGGMALIVAMALRAPATFGIQGSTFTLTLPYHAADRCAVPVPVTFSALVPESAAFGDGLVQYILWLGYGWSIRHRGLPESALSASKVG